MKSSSVLILCWALLLPAYSYLGCGEDAPKREADYGGGEGLAVSSLTYGVYQMLRSSGIPAEIGPEIETPYFPKKAQGIKVNGSPVLFLEFSDEKETDELVQSISADGRKVGEKGVTDKGTPHFFRKGKVVAAYFGERKGTVDAIELVMGKQFAGGIATE